MAYAKKNITLEYATNTLKFWLYEDDGTARAWKDTVEKEPVLIVQEEMSSKPSNATDTAGVFYTGAMIAPEGNYSVLEYEVDSGNEYVATMAATTSGGSMKIKLGSTANGSEYGEAESTATSVTEVAVQGLVSGSTLYVTIEPVTGDAAVDWLRLDKMVDRSVVFTIRRMDDETKSYEAVCETVENELKVVVDPPIDVLKDDKDSTLDYDNPRYNHVYSIKTDENVFIMGKVNLVEVA